MVGSSSRGGDHDDRDRARSPGSSRSAPGRRRPAARGRAAPPRAVRRAPAPARACRWPRSRRRARARSVRGVRRRGSPRRPRPRGCWLMPARYVAHVRRDESGCGMKPPQRRPIALGAGSWWSSVGATAVWSVISRAGDGVAGELPVDRDGRGPTRRSVARPAVRHAGRTGPDPASVATGPPATSPRPARLRPIALGAARAGQRLAGRGRRRRTRPGPGRARDRRRAHPGPGRGGLPDGVPVFAVDRAPRLSVGRRVLGFPGARADRAPEQPPSVRSSTAR